MNKAFIKKLKKALKRRFIYMESCERLLENYLGIKWEKGLWRLHEKGVGTFCFTILTMQDMYRGKPRWVYYIAMVDVN